MVYMSVKALTCSMDTNKCCSGFCTLGRSDLQLQGSGFKFSLTEFSEFMLEPKMVYLVTEC